MTTAESQRKNIFRIARKHAAGKEDQLTELLAYLFQEEPALLAPWASKLGFNGPAWRLRTQQVIANGRLDLCLVDNGATVVVESKIGSETTPGQCRRYIDHLTQVEPGRRGLVLLTRDYEAWPAGIPDYAREHNVSLVQQRWWDVWQFMCERASPLAHDFAGMLDGEAITVPPPLAAADWEQFENALPSLRKLLDEARPELARLAHGSSKYLITSGRAGYLSIYSLTYFEGIEISLGFAASPADLRKHQRLPLDRGSPLHGALIASHVLNRRLPLDQRRQEALRAISTGGRDVVGAAWGKFPTRARPAIDVLRSADFHGQVADAVAFANDTVAHFTRTGYLPSDV